MRTLLRNGVAPVVKEIGSYFDLAKKHGFGLVTKDSTGISVMLPLLMDSSWCEYARRLYDWHLNFEIYRDLLREHLLEYETAD